MYGARIAARSSAGDGFPGVAVGSLIAFLALLAAIALLIARPWQDDTVAPHLTVAPKPPGALGDAVVVARAGGPAVADAAVANAPGEGAAIAVAPPAARARGPAVSVSSASVAAVAAAPPAAPVPSGEAPPPQAPEEIPVSSPPVSQTGAPVVVIESDSGGRTSSPGPGVPPRTAGVPGPGAPNRAGTAFAVRDGGEYVFTFWFRIEGLEWQPLGNENLLLRIVGEAGGAPTLGLQLWEWSDGEWFEPPLRGLWASGAAAGGDRFLTALGEAEWHRADLDFRASSSGDGRYLLLLDGTPVDERDGVSLIEAGSAGAEVGVGLFRDGRQVPGDSGITIADPTLFERVAAQPPAETTNP